MSESDEGLEDLFAKARPGAEASELDRELLLALIDMANIQVAMAKAMVALGRRFDAVLNILDEKDAVDLERLHQRIQNQGEGDEASA